MTPPHDEHVEYRYVGYLSRLLYTPDPGETEACRGIRFSAEDIAHWAPRDMPSEKEWRNIPAATKKLEEGVRLTGRFEQVKRIDNLAPDLPRFWVALGSLEWDDPRLPIDAHRYPVLEIRYRCLTENAQPALVWTHAGGHREERLPPSRTWTTAALRAGCGAFPESFRGIIVRLYTTTRTKEELEIHSVRFRAMTEAETEAVDKDHVRIEEQRQDKHYSALDDFIPIGVFMDADRGRRLAQMLGISIQDYWNLAFEDVVRHHHNCIALEAIDTLTPGEWKEIVSLAEFHSLKLVPMCDLRLDEEPSGIDQVLTNLVKPHIHSEAILAWSIKADPGEQDLHGLLDARARLDHVDPNHPLAVITRHTGCYPLMAPHFAASGISLYSSHAPWEASALLQSYFKLCRGQHFWMVGPAFVSATGTPEWNTCPEVRLMANTAMANGVRGWFSYSYHNDPIWLRGSTVRSLTGPFLTFSDLWLELDRRMEYYNIVAPLLACAQPAPMPKRWYAWSHASADHSKLPEGVSAVTSCRLRGPDFNLYFMVSNDVRGMASVNINIPPEIMEGLQIFDLTDFMTKRRWKVMDFERHLEMFPGQARILLVAEERVCNEWRDTLAKRMIESDRRDLDFFLWLARNYNLDLSKIMSTMAGGGTGFLTNDLEAMDRAHDMMLDLIYDAPAIAESRTHIIEASAAVCGCDGSLCRLVSRGRGELAREKGELVIPLAREFTNLRIELRHGRGAEILHQTVDLANRAKRLLAEIRSLMIAAG